MSGQGRRHAVDDDDDLDDLDDVLDQFEQPVRAEPAPASTSTPSQPAAKGDEVLTEEFKAEIAKGMESLLKELGLEHDAGSEDTQQEQLAAAWEAMLVEGMGEMSGPSTSNARTPASATSPQPRDGDFQSRVRSTMSRLRERESGLQSDSSAGAAAGDDALKSLLAQLHLGDGEESGEESEEQIQGMLEAMMGQLMSKDVLYEPLKELHDKFPDYLTKNASTISPQDKARFEAQISCVKQLIQEFERSTYRDDDERARAKIVGLMGELQSHGSPPEDLMGPLPPGFSMGADGLPEIPENCNVN